MEKVSLLPHYPPLSPSFSILTPPVISPVILLILYLYLSFLSIIFLPFSLRPLYPFLYIPSFLPLRTDREVGGKDGENTFE
jgi:hypothetical protein